jgi:hypothetical protein
MLQKLLKVQELWGYYRLLVKKKDFFVKY